MPAEHDSRVPIVVGVTGHRDLSGGASKEVLRREVDEAMDRLRGRYPHSPFVVLSPLAEGADRLVARAALERLGASLLVPLPLPEALYRQDFPSDAAQEDFDALLEAAGGVFELPLLSPRDEVAAHGLARNRQYALAGGFVADRAQVVFALWDGEDAAGTGGTGQVARWALQGHVPTECLPPEAKDRPFYYPSETDLVHVHTETGETRYRTGDSPAAPVLKRLDRYNEEVQALAGGAGGRRDVERSVDRVAGEAGPGAFDGGAEQGILARYGAADALSVRLQSRFKRRLRGIYALSAAGVLGFASIEVWAPAIALSVLFVALGLGLLWGLQREELEDRYLHARALAEGLRVGLFWTSAGVAHHVHDHYLGKQAGEMAWTRIALQNVETATRTPHIASRDTAAGPPGGRREERAAHAANGTSDGAAPATDVSATRTAWVGDQLEYYEEARTAVSRRDRRFDRVAKTAYAASLLLAAGAVGYVAVVPGWRAQAVEYVGMGIEITLALGVSVQAYGSKLGLEALERHYETARQLFADARRALEQGEEPRPVLRRLGREALLENGDWLWMNQTRDVDAPTVA
jgi:hypothetical protein